MEKKMLVLVLLYCWCVECHGANIRAEGPSPEGSGGKLQRVVVSILLGSITGLGCAVVCACLVRCIFTYMKRVPILKGPVVFSPEISPKTLESAVANQTLQVVIGGKYYMTTLPDNGLTVAVKRLEPFPEAEAQKKSVKRRIQRELETVGRLRHRHLMRLKAYISHHVDRFCLVYDYVPTGSLEDAIKDNQLQLGWDARLRIAVGIIKGLQYLHYNCTPTICHYNLKPSNVMLDADFEPRLGDCGFDPHTFHGTPSAYNAPECFPNFSIYTEKSDIYSFGVILGILLTGRDPSDAIFGEGTGGSGSRGDMGMWFRQLLETGDAREALDKSLLGEEMEEDEMLMAVRIAAVCLSDMPADRPSSDELVPMLTQLHSF